MYRLLIVDDEEIIVNGLFEIFSNMKNLDLDVYKAYSGEEAIEWLNRTRIDIVITDISMPEIDGLQLLDVIRGNWPRCMVIFLTGYNEFSYVYKAIQHKGVSYLLKNEDHEKVIEAVKSAIKEIQKEINIEDLVHKAKDRMDMARDLLQKDYFIHLLHGDSSLSISKSQFEQLGVSMYPDQPVILLLGSVNFIPTDLSYWNKIQYLNSVKLIIGQYLDTNIRCVNFMDDSYRFVLFIQPKDIGNIKLDRTEWITYYEKTVSFLKGTLEVIQSSCRELLNASVSFALSGEPCKWDMVAKKYYSLNQLLNYRIGTEIEVLLIDSEFKTSFDIHEPDAETETLEILLRNGKFNVLELYLESGQQDKFFETLSQLVEPLKDVKSKNNIAIEAYYNISLRLLSYINRSKLTEKISFFIDQDRLIQFEKNESWKEAVEYIYNLSDIIFKVRSEEQKKRADNEINYIQEFVQAHLSEELSLVRLAEQVHLNPSYLSRLFKQVTGINLSDFIENARINKAKELLRRENIKIHEVAKSVGYETAASFTRFFRKMSGCSPQEYQETAILSKRG